MRHVNCALTQPLSDARLGIPTRSGCDLCSAGSACWYPRRAYLYLQILVAERVRCTSTVSATDTCPTVRHHPQRFRSLRSRDCPPLRHERPFLPRMKRTCSMVSVSPRTAPRSSPPVSRPWVQAARPLLTSFTAVDPPFGCIQCRSGASAPGASTFRRIPHVGTTTTTPFHRSFVFTDHLISVLRYPQPRSLAPTLSSDGLH